MMLLKMLSLCSDYFHVVIMSKINELKIFFFDIEILSFTNAYSFLTFISRHSQRIELRINNIIFKIKDVNQWIMLRFRRYAWNLKLLKFCLAIVFLISYFAINWNSFARLILLVYNILIFNYFINILYVHALILSNFLFE